jgi:hypothetical protein
MMQCKQIREVLDLYVDGELSAEALEAARLHLSECAECRRAERQLLLLREGVRKAVAQYRPSATLHRWMQARFGAAPRAGRVAIAAAVTTATVLVIVGTMSLPVARGFVATRLERFAFNIDAPRTVEVEGHVICRDCELKRLSGADVMVASQGHGALETSDGKIWNFMENAVSAPLINDKSLQGKWVRIRGTIYRRAGCVEVQSYEVRSPPKSGRQSGTTSPGRCLSVTQRGPQCNPVSSPTTRHARTARRGSAI